MGGLGVLVAVDVTVDVAVEVGVLVLVGVLDAKSPLTPSTENAQLETTNRMIINPIQKTIFLVFMISPFLILI